MVPGRERRRSGEASSASSLHTLPLETQETTAKLVRQGPPWDSCRGIGDRPQVGASATRFSPCCSEPLLPVDHSMPILPQAEKVVAY